MSDRKRVLVITGGSQGIGLATAQRFLDEGFRVINLSRRPIPLGGVEHISADMQQASWTDSLSEELIPALRGATQVVVVHNAACQEFDSVANLDGDAFRRILQVNLIAPQQLNVLLVPHLPKGSAVLYVGSTLAEKAVAGCASYVASKHGLIGLMRATVQDLAERAIHSACICPGFTNTAMLRAQLDANPGFEDTITSMVTLGRLVEPEEIASVLWQAAASPVLNGAVIHANLGQIER